MLSLVILVVVCIVVFLCGCCGVCKVGNLLLRSLEDDIDASSDARCRQWLIGVLPADTKSA
jgi:hypothetical protein